MVGLYCTGDNVRHRAIWDNDRHRATGHDEENTTHLDLSFLAPLAGREWSSSDQSLSDDAFWGIWEKVEDRIGRIRHR